MKKSKDVMLNSFQHPLHFLHAHKVEILKQVQDDKMIKTVRAFTLMELMVAVIIIAVLAAVAVPQYRKAVLKSRFNSMFPVAKTLVQSNEAYYLESGRYAEELSELATESKETKFQPTLGNTEKHQYVKLTQDGLHNNLIWYQVHSPNFAGEVHCEAKTEDETAVWLCSKGLNGKPVAGKTQAGYKTWALEGIGDGTPQAVTYHNNPDGVVLELEDGDICLGTDSGGYRACREVHASNGSTCIGNTGGGCGPNSSQTRRSLFDNQSKCIGNATYACLRGSFTNNSTCEGNMWNGSCAMSHFNKSSCIGTADGTTNPNTGSSSACGSSTFEEESHCEGNLPGHCNNSTFKSGSYCEANAPGACVTDVSKYDATSYCTGKYCPVDSPKQGGGTWKECTEGQDGYGEEGRTC